MTRLLGSLLMAVVLAVVPASRARASEAPPVGFPSSAAAPSVTPLPKRLVAALGGLSADAAADDGVSIWISVSAADDGRARGLLRYDHARGTVEAFRGRDHGPCGFRVQDLALANGVLWVATDLGLSRLDTTPDSWDEWRHFVRAGNGVEEVSCGALLGEVARAALLDGAGETERQRMELLVEFRPGWVRRHLRDRERSLAERLRAGRLAEADLYAAVAGRRAVPLLIEILSGTRESGSSESDELDHAGAALALREAGQAASDQATLVRALERASGRVHTFAGGLAPLGSGSAADEWPMRTASERAHLILRWQEWWDGEARPGSAWVR